MSNSPAPAPFPSAAPALYSGGSTSSEEDETTEYDDNEMVNPSPVPSPFAMPLSHADNLHGDEDDDEDRNIIEGGPQPDDNDNSEIHQQTYEYEHHEQHEHSPPKEDKQNASLKAAAEIINTLDSAYAEMKAQAASSAREADEARNSAREAAEILRRYTTRSHPREGSVTFDSRSSSAANTKTTRAPMMNVHTSPFTPSSEENKEGKDERRQYHPRHFPRTPPSVADRIAKANAEDVLSLSLEVERMKQALEGEQISHDETRNALAEEKAENVRLQQKLQKLENSMETQRENLGRSGDALENELRRAKLRVEAAEEDAQLALELAKDAEETREQLESYLQQVLSELENYRSNNPNLMIASETRTPTSVGKSSLKPLDSTGEHAEEGSAKRSVRFSDPISFSNSPKKAREPEAAQEEEDEHQQQQQHTDGALAPVSTPSRPSRPLVSAGRQLLQRSLGTPADQKIHYFDYTPEKSAERRQRLRDQLKQVGSDVQILTPASSVEESPRRTPIQFSQSVSDICQAATQILLTSGQRLELDGHCWRKNKSSDRSDEMQLDTIARQYCQSVEVSCFLRHVRMSSRW
jgi:hypothetical protein